MDKWTELTDNQEILDIVSGYQLDFFGDPSSAKTSNSIQPFQRGGEVGGFGGGETSEEGGYRGGRTLRKSVSVKHFHDTQKGWREKPVVDMRDLNNFIEPVYFKMKDLSHLPSVLRRGMLCAR